MYSICTNMALLDTLDIFGQFSCLILMSAVKADYTLSAFLSINPVN